jgi:beta-aspartyl-peptidase (threonine type)
VTDVALAVHAGAGAIEHGRLGEEGERHRRRALARSLEVGRRLLRGGASALDAVEAAVRVLEDHPDFNAGLGSVLTVRGRVEMDACIVDGVSRRTGAVAVVSRLANPVSAARAVLEDGRHVLLMGEGAEELAVAAGQSRVEEAQLVTALRRAQLESARAADRTALDHEESPRAEPSDGESGMGTVGAVARDAHGGLAAATSTGGMTNQLGGRVGDTPLLGAGTWADEVCAVSGTGTGEAFVRSAFAHQVAARVRYEGRSLDDACRLALADVADLDGRGGCIAIGSQGEPVLRFDTTAMFRGLVTGEDPPRVALYEEPLSALDAAHELS